MTSGHSGEQHATSRNGPETGYRQPVLGHLKEKVGPEREGPQLVAVKT